MSFLSKINKKTLCYYLLAFLVPMIFVLISFSKMGIYPYGEDSLLNMDLWGQYFPMYVEKYNNIKDFDSGLFSWNGALGFNLFAQTAYYGNSIFNYILLLFNRDSLVEVFNYIILIKICFSSLTFCIFLKNKFNKINILTVSCSVAYSLCGYILAFVTQPMWLDAVILLPIIILGLERLVLTKKPALYCVALAITIISNFYISFSVCLFIVLYFIVFIVSHSEHFKFKDIKASVINFAIFSLIAGGIAAFTILPVYKAIGLTLASEMTKPESFEWYNSIFEYISKLLPLTQTSLAYGIPNIYSGGFIFIMLPLFLINSKISVRKKFTYSALVAFLYASMNLNILDYIWHGLHFPNQLPGRWTFIFSFVVILICYETLINIKGISYKGVFFSLFHALLFITIIENFPEKLSVGSKIIDIMFIGMLIYAILLFVNVMFKKPIVKKIAIVGISLLMISEVGVNFVKVMDRDVRTSNIESYNHANKMMSESVYSFKSGEDDFYRMEMHEGWTFNPGQLFDYKGVSYYSSTMSGDAYNFFEGLGYRVYAKNVSTVYNPFSPVMNSFFSIKYITDKSNSLELNGMNEIYSGPNYKILENEMALPIAFMVDNDLMGWDSKGDKNPIEIQNSFLNAAMGQEVNVFEKMAYESASVANASLTYDENWEKQKYTKVDANNPVQFKFGYTIQKDQHLYLQHGFKKGNISVSINGITKKFEAAKSPFKAIGHVKTGDVVDIYVDISDVGIGVWGIDLVTLNEEKFLDCYNQLNENSAQIIKATDTKIKCKVNSDGDGVLYTSIPDDGGWTVKCNGRKLTTHRIGDYLLAVVVPQGENTLEFSYHVPGLTVGAIISIICLALLVLYILLQKEKIAIKFINIKKPTEINLYKTEDINTIENASNDAKNDIDEDKEDKESNEIDLAEEIVEPIDYKKFINNENKSEYEKMQEELNNDAEVIINNQVLDEEKEE